MAVMTLMKMMMGEMIVWKRKKEREEKKRMGIGERIVRVKGIGGIMLSLS